MCLFSPTLKKMGVESPNYINLQCFHYFYLGCMKGKVLWCFVNPGTFCFSARSLVSCSIQLFDSILGKPFLLSSFCLFKLINSLIWPHRVLDASCGIFQCGAQTPVAVSRLSCSSIWDLCAPDQRSKLISPALLGRFLTTGSSQKSCQLSSFDSKFPGMF